MEVKKAVEAAMEIPEDEEETKALGEEEVTRRQSVRGIYFEENYKRIYPLESLACDVIGFTDSADTATWGLGG